MLLEVVVALALIGAMGAGVLRLAVECAGSAGRAHASDAELRQANALMEAAALWSREDLDRHLGWRRQGEWLMGIERQPWSIYVIRLARGRGETELLRTSLYRPEIVQ